MDDVSLVAEFKKIIEARSRQDPLILAMSKDVVQVRTEMKGMNQSINLALGNSRNAVERIDKLEERKEFETLREIIMIQADTITGMQNELITFRADLKKAMERLDVASAYLKSKGMP